jgi:hypothetical protein
VYYAIGAGLVIASSLGHRIDLPNLREDLVHYFSGLSQRWPDLMPVHEAAVDGFAARQGG